MLTKGEQQAEVGGPLLYSASAQGLQLTGGKLRLFVVAAVSFSSDYANRGLDLPQVYFVNQKQIGKEYLSDRLTTDDETDLGQV